MIRQACDSDSAAIRDFLGGLSLRARYLRFFTGAVSTSPAMMRILAGGRDRTDVVVAIEDGAIVGHGMAADAAGSGSTPLTEIGVVVTDACQGRGIGSALVRMLAARAQARGVTGTTMEVLAENRQVLAMITDHWPAASVQRSGAFVTIQAQLPLPGESEPPPWAEQRAPRWSWAMSRPGDRRPPQPRHGRPTRHGEEQPSGRLALSR